MPLAISIFDQLASIVVVSGVFSTLIITIYKTSSDKQNSFVSSAATYAESLSTAAASLVNPLNDQLSQARERIATLEDQVYRLEQEIKKGLPNVLE